MTTSPQSDPAPFYGASFIDRLFEALRKLLGFPSLQPVPVTVPTEVR